MLDVKRSMTAISLPLIGRAAGPAGLAAGGSG